MNILKFLLFIFITLNLISCGSNENDNKNTVKYNITKDTVDKINGFHNIEASLSKEVTKATIEKIAKIIKNKSSNRSTSTFITFYTKTKSSKKIFFARADFDPELAVYLSNKSRVKSTEKGNTVNDSKISEAEKAYKNKIYLAKLKGITFNKTKAFSELSKKEVSDRTNIILSKLKKIPTSKFKSNLDLYKEVYIINDYNKKYLDKAFFGSVANSLPGLTYPVVANSFVRNLADS